MLARCLITILSLALATVPLHAQTEADLKRYFEGKRVTLKIDMPGTEQGVDIHPGTERPLDYPRYAARLKDHGTAIEAGDDAMITKIRVKSSHIEFQLDGGGYGTMSDETSSTVYVESAPKSNREKNLEAELKREKDSVRRRALREELEDLRTAREREDARNRAEVADAEAQKEDNIRQRRLAGGSRFNVRYRETLPTAVLTPQGLEAALAEYVAFPSLPVNSTAAGAGVTADDLRPAEAEPPGPRLPRKGMTVAELEELLGDPVQTSERPEGTLRIVTRTYRFGDGQVTAEFVEDVLFRYAMTSR
ncbi:MAG TPA: hypothetical protein VG500_10165 [Gemmatimonadales bacterium]|nr:hypothetical protein [Gemmatimonadales bacterium]